ncbi:transposase [Micromonospora olivasterospora]|uniref:Transposase n=1 Tax=Micromonospora olivasterospora TaxID=1880 RepID=A0A562IK45_MICOL|nr:transposase [Micromonospora olivasterospora]
MVRGDQESLTDGEQALPAQFKADAVALYRSRPGATIAQIADDLGVNRETLRCWVRADDQRRGADEACRQDMGFSGAIVVPLLRTIANDLLRATGVPKVEACPDGVPGRRRAPVIGAGFDNQRRRDVPDAAPARYLRTGHYV